MATTTTLYPSAGAVSPIDGRIWKGAPYSAKTWSELKAATDGDVARVNWSSEQLYFNNGGGSGQFGMTRVFVCFDCSSIPFADAIINSATLSVYGVNKAGSFSGWSDANLGMTVVQASIASTANLVVADWQTIGGTRLASDKAYSAIATSAYNDFALNSSGMALCRGGVAKFALIFVGDADNVTPTWQSGTYRYTELNMADVGSNIPKLVVNWDYPDAAGFRYRKSGASYAVCTTSIDPGGNRKLIRKSGVTYYMPLVATGHDDASDLRVRVGGTTYAGLLIT